MYKNFNLTETEREQILNNHKEHGYKQPVNEQMGNADRMPFHIIYTKLKQLRPGAFFWTEIGGQHNAQVISGTTQTEMNPIIEYRPDFDESNYGRNDFVYQVYYFKGKTKMIYNTYNDPSEVSGYELNKILAFMLKNGPQPVTPSTQTQTQQTTVPTTSTPPQQQKPPVNEGQELLKDVFKSLIK